MRFLLALIFVWPAYACANAACSKMLGAQIVALEAGRLRPGGKHQPGDLVFVLAGPTADTDLSSAEDDQPDLLLDSDGFPRAAIFQELVNPQQAIVRLHGDIGDLDSTGLYFIPSQQLQTSTWARTSYLEEQIRKAIPNSPPTESLLREEMRVPDWSGESLSLQSPAVHAFMEGARRLRAQSAFRDLPPLEQLYWLQIYTLAIIEWQEFGMNARLDGATTFHEVILSGRGVCRHLAILLGLILHDAGFETRLVASRPEDSEIGHAWLEVDLASESSTIVVDPSNGEGNGYIRSLTEIRKNPTSVEKRWYLR